MDPVPDPCPTLARALAWHLRAMRAKGCTDRSLTTLETEVEKHLAPWLARPLDQFRRHEVADLHEHLTEHSGPYLANRVMQQLRAVYNTAIRRSELVPPTNPVIAVTFNRMRRRREPIPWDELPAWVSEVDRLRNPIRRDLQRFLLLTGLRSLDARTVRHEHLDLSTGTLHRPRPKGGETRAFTIPLSTPALAIARRRLRSNPADLGAPDEGWLFPTRNRAGAITHVAEPKQQRTVAGRKVRHLPSPHRLRDTFATAAHECGIHPLDLKTLLNHALPSTADVTEGYIRPSLEHLRVSTEQVGEFLVERMGLGDGL